MQRLLFQRLTPYLVGRIRQNQRLLSSSSSALQQSLSSDPSPSPDDIYLTENCVRVCSLSLSKKKNFGPISQIWDLGFVFASILCIVSFKFVIFIGFVCFMDMNDSSKNIGSVEFLEEEYEMGFLWSMCFIKTLMKPRTYILYNKSREQKIKIITVETEIS